MPMSRMFKRFLDVVPGVGVAPSGIAVDASSEEGVAVATVTEPDVVFDTAEEGGSSFESWAGAGGRTAAVGTLVMTGKAGASKVASGLGVTRVSANREAGDARMWNAYTAPNVNPASSKASTIQSARRFLVCFGREESS